VLATADAQDLLGRWSVQLGRSAMLALDPQGPGNRPLLESASLARLIAAGTDWVMMSPDASRVQGRLEQAGDALLVEIHRLGFQEETMEPLTGQVAPLGEPAKARPFQLLPSAPGTWKGRCDLWPDPYDLAVEVRDATGRKIWQQRSTAGEQAEYARIGPDFQALEELAAITGGKVVRPWQLGENLRTFHTGRAVALWPWAAGLALLLMLLDWPLDALRARRG
jgi:hypothetical protein